MNASIGNWLLLLGAVLLIAGAIVKLGFLNWLGHLPGDFHVKREGYQFYLPLGSMLVVSIVMSALISLVRKFF